jgi:hypothetical protein
MVGPPVKVSSPGTMLLARSGKPPAHGRPGRARPAPAASTPCRDVQDTGTTRNSGDTPEVFFRPLSSGSSRRENLGSRLRGNDKAGMVRQRRIPASMLIFMKHTGVEVRLYNRSVATRGGGRHCNHYSRSTWSW